MFRKWLKCCLPTKESIRNHSSLRGIHGYLRHPEIWNLTCTSTALGTAVGLFVAFIPLPFQMLLAALLAILLRANLPVSILMTWITNPITFIPINYLIYFVGSKVLNEPIGNIKMVTWNFDDLANFWSSFTTQFSQVGKAYLIGLPITALVVAVTGYFLVAIIWQLGVFFSKKKKKK